MQFGARDFVPVDCDFLDRKLELATQLHQLDVECPARQVQRREKCLGALPIEKLEAALSVSDFRAHYQPHAQMESTHQ